MTHFRRTLIWRILLIVVCTVLLSAILTIIFFVNVGTEAFAGIKAEELLPKARYIGVMSASFLQLEIGSYEYERALGNDNDIWGASLYGYRSDSRVFLSPTYSDSQENRAMIALHLETVFEGNEVVDRDGLVIGVPIISKYGNVMGAVFLVKPLAEVRIALGNMIRALLLSIVLVFGLMLVPAYLASSSITRPVRRMTGIATGMAEGNFLLMAEEKGQGELATLGRSLNHLSLTLSRTISDLTFERNRLKSILDGMSEGLIALSTSGKILHFNPAASRLLGGAGNKLPVNSPVVERIYSEVKELQAGRTHEFSMENGEMTLRVSFAALSANGEYAGAVALLCDVTEAMRYEQARRDYVANVSHELRTPISSILGLADALSDGLVKDESDKERYYHYMVSESKRMSRLIDDLLELSRLQSGTVAFQKSETDVCEMMTYVTDNIRGHAELGGKSVITDIEPGLPRGLTNADRAEQVLIALLDNAISHTEDGADIVVSCRRMTEEDAAAREKDPAALGMAAQDTKNRLIISVMNRGEIPDSDINHLFERFYKVDKAHSGGGTGLGLAIAKEVMDILGERIWVESANGYVVFSFTMEVLESGRALQS